MNSNTKIVICKLKNPQDEKLYSNIISKKSSSKQFEMNHQGILPFVFRQNLTFKQMRLPKLLSNAHHNCINEAFYNIYLVQENKLIEINDEERILSSKLKSFCNKKKYVTVLYDVSYYVELYKMANV